MDSEVICYSQKREIKLPVSATHNPLNDDSNSGSTPLDNYLIINCSGQPAAATTYGTRQVTNCQRAVGGYGEG